MSLYVVATLKLDWHDTGAPNLQKCIFPNAAKIMAANCTSKLCTCIIFWPTISLLLLPLNHVEDATVFRIINETCFLHLYSYMIWNRFKVYFNIAIICATENIKLEHTLISSASLHSHHHNVYQWNTRFKIVFHRIHHSNG